MKSRTQMPNSRLTGWAAIASLVPSGDHDGLSSSARFAWASRVIAARALPSAFMPSTSHRDPAESDRVDAKAIRVPTFDQAGR